MLDLFKYKSIILNVGNKRNIYNIEGTLTIKQKHFKNTLNTLKT